MFNFLARENPLAKSVVHELMVRFLVLKSIVFYRNMCYYNYIT